MCGACGDVASFLAAPWLFSVRLFAGFCCVFFSVISTFFLCFCCVFFSVFCCFFLCFRCVFSVMVAFFSVFTVSSLFSLRFFFFAACSLFSLRFSLFSLHVFCFRYVFSTSATSLLRFCYVLAISATLYVAVTSFATSSLFSLRLRFVYVTCLSIRCFSLLFALCFCVSVTILIFMLRFRYILSGSATFFRYLPYLL